MRTFKRYKANVNLVLCRPLLHLPNLFVSVHIDDVRELSARVVAITCFAIENACAYTHAHKFSGIRPILSTRKFDTSANGANMVDGCNKARLRAERIEPSMLGNPPSSVEITRVVG